MTKPIQSIYMKKNLTHIQTLLKRKKKYTKNNN